jgi:hypothetical protein
MGLLGMLAGLPLAPVRGVAALARHLQQQAEREWEDELAQLQAMLLELELTQAGKEEELASKEAELLAKVAALAGTRARVEDT